jgi:hypothetical protein
MLRDVLLEDSLGRMIWNFYGKTERESRSGGEFSEKKSDWDSNLSEVGN